MNPVSRLGWLISHELTSFTVDLQAACHLVMTIVLSVLTGLANHKRYDQQTNKPQVSIYIYILTWVQVYMRYIPLLAPLKIHVIMVYIQKTVPVINRGTEYHPLQL